MGAPDWAYTTATSDGTIFYDSGNITISSPNNIDLGHEETNREWLDRRVKEICNYWK